MYLPFVLCHIAVAFVEICLKVESNRPLGRSRAVLGLEEALVVHPRLVQGI